MPGETTAEFSHTQVEVAARAQPATERALSAKQTLWFVLAAGRRHQLWAGSAP